MNFSQEYYYSKMVKTPISIAVLSIVLIIVLVIFLSKIYRNKEMLPLEKTYITIVFSCVIFGLVFFVYYNLSRTNLDLLQETTENLVQEEIIVEEIDCNVYKWKFYYNDKVASTCIINSDNHDFIVMHIGDIKEGSTISVTYLQKSKVVIEVDIIE